MLSDRRKPGAIVIALWVSACALLLGAACPSPNPYGIAGPKRGIADAYSKAIEAKFGWAYVFVEWGETQQWSADPPEDPCQPGILTPCRSCLSRGDCQTVCPLNFERPYGPTNGGQWPQESTRDRIHNAYSSALSVIVAFGGRPTWVTSSNLQDKYSKFVTATVACFKDEVVAWELWNEPNWDADGFTPATFRDVILPAGFDAVKQADGAALVVAPGIFRGDESPPGTPDYSTALNDWITYQSGAQQNQLIRPIDVLSLHTFSASITQIKAWLDNASNFAANHPTPAHPSGIPEVWNTSFGFGAESSCAATVATSLVDDRIISVNRMMDPNNSTEYVSRFRRSVLYNLHDRRPPSAPDCKAGLLGDTDPATEKPWFQGVKTYNTSTTWWQ